MAVLVYVDNSNGQIPNSSKEAVFYGSQIANSQSTETVALVVGSVDNELLEALGNYGAGKVLCVNNPKLDHFDSQIYFGINF